jgi:hypothetical protein
MDTPQLLDVVGVYSRYAELRLGIFITDAEREDHSTLGLILQNFNWSRFSLNSSLVDSIVQHTYSDRLAVQKEILCSRIN